MTAAKKSHFNIFISLLLMFFSGVLASDYNVPSYVAHPYSYTSFWRPPFCFKAATPWLNIMHDDQSTESSTVQIDYLRLYGRIHGRDSLIAANEYASGKYGGQICLKNPWFGETCETITVAPVGGCLVVEPGKRPDRVYHFWLERWPQNRPDVSKFDSLWLDVRARISGPALIQAGMDYYQALNYPAGETPQERGASDWFCRQNEWFNIKLDRSTEVINKPLLAEKYHLGKTLSIAFTLKNFDNQTVRIAELGVEIRRIDTPDNCFYWKENPQIMSGFTWMNQSFDLAPGESIDYASSWTPGQTGDYYLTIIERRANSTKYQRPYCKTIDVIHVVEPTAVAGAANDGNVYDSVFNVYPSPFNSRLSIGIDLPQDAPVNISVYNVTGKLVGTLVDEILMRGRYTFHWIPQLQPSGIYIVKLATDNKKQTKSALYIK